MRAGLVFLFLLAGSSVPAQYGLGLRSGIHAPGPAPRGISNTTTRSLGLVYQRLPDEGAGFRIAVDALARGFHSNQYNAGSSLQEVLQYRTFSLQFSSEVRFALGTEALWFFDMGPVIGVAMFQEWSGEGYYHYQPDFPYRVFQKDQARSPQINEARLRLGLSRDILLSDRILLTVNGAIAPGAVNWERLLPIVGLQPQLLVSLMIIKGRPQLPPAEIPDPVGHRAPGNSRLSALMQ
jgi:hypothetical protein